ncbi:unnamed protein product [Trifolium pratense]|uniref:Uncharacterized protein n=1 Tax=Trifolium pratense TaxID=57577 RepID=A0ACB0J1B0_TRIPR|nr:unnamed protein product [Trifolium pratense]
MLPLKRKLSSSYTCTAVSHTAPRDSPPDHLCQEDFRYKEPIQPFVEPSALIPLLGHHERAAGGSSTLGLRTTLQMNALFIGYDLTGYIDGTTKCPPKTDPNFNFWTRQDQLILHAIITSVDPSIITALGNVKTSQQAWEVLQKMFASKTRSRIMHLKERLSRLNKGASPVSEYLNNVKAIADELAIINSPLDDIDLVIHTLNGLGTEYREITTAIRARENPISFDNLHDLLTDFETYLKRDEINNDSSSLESIAKRGNSYGGSYPNNGGSTSSGQSRKVICQYCDKTGHSAKICYKLHGYPRRTNSSAAHHARTNNFAAHHARATPGTASSQEWIMDSGATHHITNALDNLHLNRPYHGTDELLIGDGSGLPITHTGFEDKGSSNQRSP